MLVCIRRVGEGACVETWSVSLRHVRYDIAREGSTAACPPIGVSLLWTKPVLYRTLVIMDGEDKLGASGIGTHPLLQRSIRDSLSFSKRNVGSHGTFTDSLAARQRRSWLGMDDATHLAVASGGRLAKQMHAASEMSVGGWRMGMYAPRVRAEATSRAVGASRLWSRPGDPQHAEEVAQLLNELNCNEESKESALGNGGAPAKAEEAPWEPPSCGEDWKQLMVGLSIFDSCDAFDPAQRAMLRHCMEKAVARISVEAVVAALHEQRKPPGAHGVDPPCPHCSDVSRPAMPPYSSLPQHTPLDASGLRSLPRTGCPPAWVEEWREVRASAVRPTSGTSHPAPCALDPFAVPLLPLGCPCVWCRAGTGNS